MTRGQVADAADVTLALQGFNATSLTVSVTELTSPNLADVNTPAEPRRVAPVETVETTDRAPRGTVAFSHTFPRYSFTTLVFV